MFKKKKTKKEDIYVISDFIHASHLLHHTYIEKEWNGDYVYSCCSFSIKKKNIATYISDMNRSKFEFNRDLSEELVKELRPIILKWVEDSKSELEKQNK